ncbi:MAG TPA: AI-2E family transporter [Gemmatimonadaceae bacterium]|nr:AI-2E family transporter [Gemmatimonadaceae bacterium]
MAPLASGRTRAQILIVALGAVVAYAIAPYASGLLGAAILYVIGAPMHKRLSRVLGAHGAAAIVLVVLGVLIILPGAWIINLVIVQAPIMLANIQRSAFLERLSALRIEGVDLGAQIASASGTLVSWLSGHAIGFFGSATRSVLNLVIAFFGLYYLLISANTAWRWVAAFLPFSKESNEQLRLRFTSITEAMLLGTALTAVLQGALIGFAFWLVGLPNAVFWGVITAFASILPVLGSALVWLPGVIVLLVQQRFGAAIALLIIGGLIASNLDNVVRPVVYRRVSDVHPLTTLVGAFAGVSLFGLVGLLLGPLAITYFFELIDIYEQEYGRNAVILHSPSAHTEPVDLIAP